MTTDKTKNFFRVSAENFKKIPGSPIAYWVGNKIFQIFSITKDYVANLEKSKGKNVTTNNARFIRFIWEVSLENIGAVTYKWFPCALGGNFRKWIGNIINVIDWSDNAKDFYRKNPAGSIIRQEFWNMPGVTWSKISSSSPSFRLLAKEEMYQETALLQNDKNDSIFLLGILNSKVALHFLHFLSPTINYQHEDICAIPLPETTTNVKLHVLSKISLLISKGKSDWDSYETSWNFQENPLILEAKKTAIPSKAGCGFLSGNGEDKEWIETSQTLVDTYIMLRRQWQRQTKEMRKLEIENNHIFIDAYGLQDELSPEVPWNEITLTCNPWYRYGKKLENFNTVCNDFILAKKERIEISPVNTNDSDARPSDSFPFAKDIEERLLQDTIKEFISYAVGCMMGRYSPEKPGLILANQGDRFSHYHEIMSGKTAEEISITRDNITSQHHVICDSDGVIPILDEEWFADDIVAQFKDFLKLTFGTEHFTENLEFVEKALGKDIRKYFVKDFYKDHVQRYKKRPIYWMFSSPKGSFNALIYLHRYQPDTVSIVLNEYLREFMTKLRVQREHLISNNIRTDLTPAEKNSNMKLINKYAAMLAELEAYERDVLFPLAQKQIAIDLDDGVKVNYVKFGDALKKIPGLEAKEK